MDAHVVGDRRLLLSGLHSKAASKFRHAESIRVVRPPSPASCESNIRCSRVDMSAKPWDKAARCSADANAGLRLGSFGIRFGNGCLWFHVRLLCSV